MNFNLNELVKLKQAFGPDIPQLTKYFTERAPKTLGNELETGILNKYNAWNTNRTKMCACVSRKSGRDIILDDLVDGDEHKVQLLMESCQGINSVDQAKFWLEAADYDIKEAETLFKESQKPSGQVKITLNMATGQQQVKFYEDFQQVWEIGKEVFQNSGKTFDFSIYIEELNQALNVQQMKEKNFSEFGLKSMTFIVLT